MTGCSLPETPDTRWLSEETAINGTDGLSILV